MSERIQKNAIIIDDGYDAPRKDFASVVKCLLKQNVMSNMGEKKTSKWNVAYSKRGIFSMKYPVAHGIVTNWDDMEKIWNYTFYNELRVAPEDHPVLLTEAPLNPKAIRETMTHITFGTINAPAMYEAIQAVLSGRTTGIAFDSDDGVSHTMPIYQGSALFRMDLFGRNLMNYPMEALTEHDLVKDLAFVSTTSSLKPSYTLPNGQVIKFIDESLCCPEQPALTGLQVCGGTILCPSIVSRLKKELTVLIPTMDLNIVDPPKYSVWEGQYISALLTSFKRMWINEVENM